MSENFANFFATLLSGSIDDSVTTIVVNSVTGAPIAPDYRLLIQDGEDDPTNRELVKVTAVAGTSLTVERGAEGTTPVAHADNSFVAHVITAEGLVQAIEDRSENIHATIAVVLDGLGDVVTLGVKVDLTLHFSCEIDGWTLLADQSGSIDIDIWKDTYANYPPTVADSIVGTVPPAISGANKAEGTDMEGWDGIIAIGDVLRFNVDSCSSITRATLLLHVTRT